MNKREVGNNKEDMAYNYLISKGYRVLNRNYRTRQGEIDLIALDGECLCFFEVKYRKNEKSGFPEEAVSYNKMFKISRCTDHYLLTHQNVYYNSMRFDVIAILGEELKHYENAFNYIQR